MKDLMCHRNSWRKSKNLLWLQEDSEKVPIRISSLILSLHVSDVHLSDYYSFSYNLIRTRQTSWIPISKLSLHLAPQLGWPFSPIFASIMPCLHDLDDSACPCNPAAPRIVSDVTPKFSSKDRISNFVHPSWLRPELYEHGKRNDSALQGLRGHVATKSAGTVRVAGLKRKYHDHRGLQ
jgi:hypothetical protein